MNQSKTRQSLTPASNLCCFDSRRLCNNKGSGSTNGTFPTAPLNCRHTGDSSGNRVLAVAVILCGSLTEARVKWRTRVAQRTVMLTTIAISQQLQPCSSRASCLSFPVKFAPADNAFFPFVFVFFSSFSLPVTGKSGIQDDSL